MSRPSEAPLDSWKAIAAYLNRDVRTVRRWEASEGLPVHRYRHLARSSVYAYPGELDAWRAARQPERLAPVGTSRGVLAGGVAALVFLALLAAGDGWMGRDATAQGLAGQAARLVWTGQEAFGSVRGTVSPDGRYLTYLDVSTGALALRDLRDNTSRILAQVKGASMFYAVFSSDGRRIAYSWWTRSAERSEFDLRVLPRDARGADAARVVYRNEEMSQLRPFGWTPDGRQVLALRSFKDGTNQIALVAAADGAVSVIKSIPWNFSVLSLSPDGRYVAYESLPDGGTAPNRISVVAIDGTSDSPAVEGSGVNSSPVWSPDGSRLLFLSNRTGNMSLWTVPMKDGRTVGLATLLKADIGRVRLQGMTRTGTLYYLLAGVGRSNVYVADVDGAKVINRPAVVSERFINSNSAPTWSPDGQYLAYLSSRQAGTVLVVRSEKTSEERDIPLPAAVLTGNLVPSPQWFPDGRGLMVFGFRPKQSGVLYRVDVAQGTAERLVEAEGVFSNGGLGSSAISPDGRSIYYIASATAPVYEGKTDLIRYDLDTRRRTVVTSGTFNALALSPDGTRIALHTYDGTPSGCFVHVMPSSGGDRREVARTGNCNPNRLAWTADDHLLFVTGANNEPNVIWRVPVSGGQPQQIGVSMSGQLMYPEMHPSGRRVAFGLFDTGASEVWALERFLPAGR